MKSLTARWSSILPTLADAEGDHDDYFGSAKLAVLHKNGSWTEIKGPASLGKGLTVRKAGLKSDKMGYLMERLQSGSAVDVLAGDVHEAARHRRVRRRDGYCHPTAKEASRRDRRLTCRD